MIRSDSDSRLLFFTLLDDGAGLAGAALQQVWQRMSRRGRLHRELRTMEQAGLLSSTAADVLDERVFRLTAVGQQELQGPVDPEACWARPWDGRWRLVLFDVPESRNALRTRLRRKLRQMRFGWMQNSVWLSPDPLEEITRQFQDDKRSVESLVLLEARPVGGESDADMVAGAWDFVRLEKLHASHLKMCRLKPGGTARVTDWLDWVRVLRRSWTQICRVDPFLPSVLLPVGYHGREAWAAYRTALDAARHAVRQLVLAT